MKPLGALMMAAWLGCNSSSSSTTAGAGGGSSAASTAVVATAASSTSSAGGGTTLDPCNACAAPQPTGPLASAAIGEASGLAASRQHPGSYYVHNDSGDVARFFAIDGTGADLGTYYVGGARALDWEDMAAGPCNARSCLYLGDVGDNLRMRSQYVIYRVPEPARLTPGDHNVVGEPLPFSYPDGSHNCETVLAHPTSGELFVVTKVTQGISSLYRFPMPLTPGVAVTLEKLTDLTPPTGNQSVTSGDIHPTSLGVLLRTYTHLWFYPIATDVPAALGTMPCGVPVAMEDQGEAVAWTIAGDGYLTVSEGSQSQLFLSQCGR
jgi:hypothetical protein